MITIIGASEFSKLSRDTDVINTTSMSKNWSKGLSPFFLGPVKLYANFESKNVENAWQYSKVYNNPQFFDSEKNQILPEYYKWAQRGWSSIRADRYPMGKGAAPLFSLWDNQRLGYIEARHKIYAPVYAAAVTKSEAFRELKKIYSTKGSVTLFDFDGYSFNSETSNWEDAINNPKKKMGHAFVLGMLLDDKLIWEIPPVARKRPVCL